MTETNPNPSSPRRVSLWVQVPIWSVLIAVLVLVGMGLRRTEQGTVQPGDKIPDFGLTFFSGYEYSGLPAIRVSELRGKVVLLNFWASWCKPCEQEAPHLEEAWEYYRSNKDVVFLGIDYVDTEPAARIFLKKFRNSYPNGPDTGTVISQLFRIKGVPETYILDTQGVIRYVEIGPFANAGEIKALIDPVLPK
jgi:cytochrome c biogenesis protein CcmG, thiol:disulfide interchange protein DsbE